MGIFIKYANEEKLNGTDLRKGPTRTKGEFRLGYRVLKIVISG